MNAPATIAGRLRYVLAAALAGCLAAGCNTGGHTAAPTTSSPPATTQPPPPTTAPGPQTSGTRTVLSPVGLRVHKAPSKSAPVLGSAAEGVALTVLGYTSSDGGWFKVKGATVTGWITALPTLSAPGEFQSYSSSQFAALYPNNWTEAALHPSAAVPPTSAGAKPAATSSVVFHPTSGSGDIVVTAAGSVAQLPQGRAGYSRKSVTQVVACGVTAGLVVFQQSGAPPANSSATSVPQSLTYLAEIRFAVDKQHALGVYADMTDLGATFQIVKALVSSMTFNSPQC